MAYAEIVATCPLNERHKVAMDCRAIQAECRTGISPKRSDANDNVWHIWCAFCQALNQDEYLSTTTDPIPLLQLFAHRYRIGDIAPSGAPVRSRTVEGALCAIGQTFAALGHADPRLLANGQLDLRLHRQLSAYKKLDPPPSRVKPIPLSIITHAAHLNILANIPSSIAIADMLLLGFFFLLRPGEYAWTHNPEAAPFLFRHVHLSRGSTRLNLYHDTPNTLQTATHVALELDKQKNGVRGELVGLG
jgi:hypothetical protein